MTAQSGLFAAVFALAAATAGPCFGCCETRWRSSWNGTTWDLSGTIEFTDDDRDVKSISPGGFLRIADGMWVTPSRLYEVKPDGWGKLSHLYYVDGKGQPLAGPAQAWVRGAMLDIIRESGAGAGPRVQRILRKGGPSAVLAEVAEIRSDGSKRIYLKELIDHGHLDEMHLRDAMRSVRGIGSDGDKSALLIDVSTTYLRPGLRDAWFSAAGTIGSDGDHRNALQRAVQQDSSGEALALASRSAAGIGSDGDKAAVLAEIARHYRPDARAAWVRAANSIGSDGDHRFVLETLLREGTSDRDTIADALWSAQRIGSDGDKAAVLMRAAENDLRDDAVRRAFFAAAKSIGSDGDRGNVLRNVVQSRRVAPETVAAAVDCATGIGSDGDKASVLMAALDRHGSEPVVRAALQRALESVHSDGDYRRLSAALLDKR